MILARVRIKRPLYFNEEIKYVLCADHAEVNELRRLLKCRTNKPHNVTVTRHEMHLGRDEIRELERIELRNNLEVLTAIAELT